MELKVVNPTRKYEALIILHPDISEKEQKDFFKKQQKILKDFGGEFNHIDTWGKRRLGNPIKKLKVGNYFHSTFEAKAEAIAELERTMRITDQVLRFTHTRLDDRKSVSQHLEDYRKVVKASNDREAEREKAFQARKAAKKKF